MNNDRQNGNVLPPEEEMDFFAAGKEARHVHGGENVEMENRSRPGNRRISYGRDVPRYEEITPDPLTRKAPAVEPVVEETPAEEPVVEEAPAEEPVVEETPVEEPVAEETPVEAPVEEPVVEEAPVEEPVVEETPVEEPVVEEAPMEEPVKDEIPAAEPEAPFDLAAMLRSAETDETAELMETLLDNGRSEIDPKDALAAAILGAGEDDDEAFFARLDEQAASFGKAAPAAEAPEEPALEDEFLSEPSDPEAEAEQAAFAAAAEPEEEEYPEEEEPPVRRRKGGLIVGIAAALICLMLVASAAIVNHRATIFPNVSAQGVDLGAMTVEEAEQAMKAAGWDGADRTLLTVTLPADESFEVSAGDTGWTATAADVAKAAWDYGRDGNFFTNFITYIQATISGYDLTDDLSSEPDTKTLQKLVSTAVKAANLALTEGNMEIDTEKKELRLVKGGDLLMVDQQEVYDQMMKAIEEHKSELNCVKSISEDAEGLVLDLEKLHDDVCGEAENASYDVDKKEVVDGKPGIEFDVKEAQRLWDEAKVGDLVRIPLEITEPDFTKDDVKELFADRLSSKSTSLSGSSTNRINNITLAASKINGVILQPGDTFSYNNTVGQRTTARGFREAGAYMNGEVVQEVGGGICQVSSTLYYCAMTANLKITARTNHYFSVGYIEPGMDATVSWGAPDFRFQNDRTFPVKIQAYVKNGSLTVEIWGTDVDGTTVKMDYTTSGMTTTTYRNVYDKDGKLLTRTQEAVSTYHRHEEAKPTATPRPVTTPTPAAPTATPAAPTATPAPTPTPEPTPAPTPPPEETSAPPETSAPEPENPPEDGGE